MIHSGQSLHRDGHERERLGVEGLQSEIAARNRVSAGLMAEMAALRGTSSVVCATRAANEQMDTRIRASSQRVSETKRFFVLVLADSHRN